jgi:hypothetical protein
MYKFFSILNNFRNVLSLKLKLVINTYFRSRAYKYKISTCHNILGNQYILLVLNLAQTCKAVYLFFFLQACSLLVASLFNVFSYMDPQIRDP